MKKALALLGLGLVAMFAMGADDDCSVEEDPKPAKQANQSNVNQGGQSQKPSQSAPEPAEPAMTAGQENAVQAASDYLGYSNFSKPGLEEQLVYEGYPKKDAKFAVNQMDVDWNQQAYQAAKDYLNYSSFSLSALVDQLVYEGYTQAQAEYGANKAYNE